jgi:5-methylcytosine-specific restriction endonuclease McrA
MHDYTLTHLADDVLLRGLAALVVQDRTTTANLLAHMAEVDARRLYAPAGYTSMHAYCVEKLGLSDDATWKRLQVAKKARQFPVLYLALKEGRVHLTGLNLLAPYLTAENVDELVSAADGLRKSAIELLVARRFPRVEALRLDEGISALPSEPAPAQVAPSPVVASSAPAPAQVVVRPRVAPIDGRRFSLEVTIEQATHDKLRRAQELLGHAGNVAGVLDRALDALLDNLEKRKFAKTSKPRRPRLSRGVRTIPAHVRRAVLERDGGRCTFVGGDGHRCEARRFLEFDHVVPVARGGVATVDQIRTLCRTHNQLEAERVFGRVFMKEKRRPAPGQV